MSNLSAPVLRSIGTVVIVGFLAVAAIACGQGDGEPSPTPAGQCQPGDPSCTLRQPVHWHADVALYINGEQFDFGQPQYLSTEDQELSTTVHVHDPRHTVVHIHLEQTTWDEFFQSLGMKVTDSCITLPEDEGGEVCEDDTNKLTFVVNGIRVDSIRELNISDLQRTLIWYGPEPAEEVLAQWEGLVSDESCIPSGDCADRAPENPEEEPCSVSSTTCN